MKIIHVITEADLRCGYKGLTELARKNRINTSVLYGGNFIAFVNRAKNAVKLLGADDIVTYLPSNGEKLTLKDMENIGKYYEAGPTKFLPSVKVKFRKELRNFTEVKWPKKA